MMPKATDPTVLPDRDDSPACHDDADTTAGDGAVMARVDRLAARLAGLELDPETVEIIMAALTADVCDHIEATDN
jgi:hypothetical protein